ncbi:MAG TPA: FKBP-type peptidyl-prolyl cis-trans isomerase [Chryseosolibacter sp.]
MIKYSYVLLGVFLVLMSCQKSEKETANGFKYTVLKAGSGEAPKKGEIIVFDFQLKDSKDSIWNESYKDGMPAAIELRDTSEIRQMDGITQMLSALKKGDSVKASLPVTDFFKNLIRRPVPPNVDSTLTLTYYINVAESMTLENFMKWRNEKVITRDDKMINDYLTKNNLTAQKDSTGLYIVNHTNGTGPKPSVENCVQVKYEGKLLANGRPFDQNENISFSLMQVIRGWQIGFPQLAKGDSATFLIPSRLGYGPEGFYGIPPDAVLLFNVKLHDFKAGLDPATNQCK